MNGPTNIDDPSHPFYGMGAGFAQMRQKRQDFDARQQALAQALAAPQDPGFAGGAPPMQGMAPVAETGNASMMNGITSNLRGLYSLAQQQGGPGVNGSGPIAGGGWFAKDGGAKSPTGPGANQTFHTSAGKKGA